MATGHIKQQLPAFQPQYRAFDASQHHSNSVQVALNWSTPTSQATALSAAQHYRTRKTAHNVSSDNWLNAVQHYNYTILPGHTGQRHHQSPSSGESAVDAAAHQRVEHYYSTIPYHTAHDPAYTHHSTLTARQQQLADCRRPLRAPPPQSARFAVPADQLHNTVNYVAHDYNVQAIPTYARQTPVTQKISSIVTPCVQPDTTHFRNNRYTTAAIQFRQGTQQSHNTSSMDSRTVSHTHTADSQPILKKSATQCAALAVTALNCRHAVTASTPLAATALTVQHDRDIVKQLQQVTVPAMPR